MTKSLQRNIPAESDSEAAFLAQALDYYRAVQRAGKEAPFGQFLNHADAAASEEGQKLVLHSLKHIVQEAADEIEKKMRHEPVRSAKRKQDTSDTVTKTSKVPAEP